MGTKKENHIIGGSTKKRHTHIPEHRPFALDLAITEPFDPLSPGADLFHSPSGRQVSGANLGT